MKRLFLTLNLLGILAITPEAGAQTAPACGETPSDVVLMLDRTASVSPEDRQKEADAAAKLVDLLLEHPQNRVAVGRFGAGDCQTSYQNWYQHTDWVDAELLETLSRDNSKLKTGISRGMGEESCGGTDLHDAIDVAQNELDFGDNPNQVLILISDGDPNQPLDETKARALALESANQSKESGTRIFTIAFDASSAGDVENRARLASLASNHSQDDSEGEVEETEKNQENSDGDDFFLAPSGDDLERVFRHIGQIILCEEKARESKKSENELIQKDFNEPEPVAQQNLPGGTLQFQGSGCSLGANHPVQDLGLLIMVMLPLMLTVPHRT